MSAPKFSVVIPAKNESATIGSLVTRLQALMPEAEVLVVDDGSGDDTAAVAQQAGARVIRHPVSRGNGAAIKAGARAAAAPTLIFMDADGQHDPAQIPALLARLDSGYDMVVGARSARMHAGLPRLFANRIYNVLASWITGVAVADLTSGFRVARADIFRQFLALLPNGFSYPTTITMAFLRGGYSVAFEPVAVQSRTGAARSHIRPLRDGTRFLVIIFKVATLYSPLKVYLPFSVFFFASGLLYYAHTLITAGRFTNLGALLFTAAIVVFLIGLVSEQITSLFYLNADRDHSAGRAGPDHRYPGA
jgi:glycosyltransferase involved in cell wall biosynthesis